MLLIGNIISLIGSLLMVSIGFIKDKKKILLAQCGQFTIMAIGNLFLGAYAGTISNVIGIVRNLTFSRTASTNTLKVFFIIAQLSITLAKGIHSAVELCPVFSTIIFTWSIDAKSTIRFKIMLILAQILWMIYDFYYHNYTAFLFDILTILSNVCGIVALRRKIHE
ncbi:MAG: YgjV family protein [Lachnospiraceae bacterium]|nr:YgjV family protein [Lachnospiraceae bacterium]